MVCILVCEKRLVELFQVYIWFVFGVGKTMV